MSIPAKQTVAPPPTTIEDLITKGDLSKLTADQRTEYYVKLCNSLGLNPLTQPFDWLVLNGKLTLYANRKCADQLRKINGISIRIVSQDYSEGLLSIHVQARDKEGREDEDLGVVAIPPDLKGDARANTILKGVTKAKRRVTLSISGLGFLDETEVEDIPAKAKAPLEVIEAGGQAPPILATPKKVDAGEPREIALGDGAVEWAWFGHQMMQVAETEQWQQWREANMLNMERMKNEDPKRYAIMIAGIKKARPA